MNHNFCIVCKITKNNVYRCGQCLGIRYCSKECQIQDWARHKVYCSQKDNTLIKSLQIFIPPTFSLLIIELQAGCFFAIYESSSILLPMVSPDSNLSQSGSYLITQTVTVEGLKYYPLNYQIFSVKIREPPVDKLLSVNIPKMINNGYSFYSKNDILMPFKTEKLIITFVNNEFECRHIDLMNMLLDNLLSLSEKDRKEQIKKLMFMI